MLFISSVDVAIVCS